ncbi:unnamed protein product [Arabidopsis thaliana]|uniref:(thale cress) hypothetical protein n=1 Tax=Arabidopsis thaliana TaxID=3702 RepID=A0A7G2EVY7_ARATH|nr:unnamed protein product [Arabidopsis thaliana]
MSSAMDKAMMAMSLDEEDLPFDMPDLPQFSSCENNVLSLIGRLLNPQCQVMSSLILNMPRKWQKEGRVRGVALSLEKFQFIFNSEHDLVEVLEKGFQTFNEWGILMERWSATPSPESLQFTSLWVQLRNVPLNHYTEQAIISLGDIVGQVTESKVINLPKGLSTTVCYFYERVQKRCYRCQRLTHEKELCPLQIRELQDQIIDRKMGKKVEKAKAPMVLKQGDVLYGVLKEEQVGIHPLLGRPRIAPDVLEGMRQYLLVANGAERLIREERVKKSVAEAEKDPISQKTVLRLEPKPIVSTDFDKGKGIVFGYESSDASSRAVNKSEEPSLQLSAATLRDTLEANPLNHGSIVIGGALVDYSYSSSFSQPSSSEYVVGLSEAGASGTKQRKPRSRKRPHISKRKPKPPTLMSVSGDGVEEVVRVPKSAGLQVGALEKRKGIMQTSEGGIQLCSKSIFSKEIRTSSGELSQHFTMRILWSGYTTEVGSFLSVQIKEDSEKWFLAQQVEKEDEVKNDKVYASARKVWKPPDKPWLKCNIASTWDKLKKVGGAAWVLRNSEGVVLLHSRRAFSGIQSKQDAALECWLWALESLRSLKIRRVILAVEEKYRMDAVLRPSAWPSFKS